DDIVLFNRFEGGDPFDALKNEDMYPVIFAASCSTAEYAIVPPWRNYDDTTGTAQIGSNGGNIFPLTFLHGEELRVAPRPHALQTSDTGCIMERFLVQYNTSGAVAYIGGVEVLQTFVNDMNMYFVEEYTSGENILGRMWNSALNSYLIDKGYGGGEHALYASGWGDVASYHHPSKVSLFGDPSLRVFDTPEPTTPTPTIPPPVYIVIIGGGFVAAVGIVFLIRRIRLRS
ncbi:MAG: C25 family cysteine peptidase, partial [Candidatus Thorarchaeota archaeon]